MRLHNRAVLIERLHHLLDRRIPLEHSLFLRVFVAKTLHLFEVPLKIELFIVVSVARLGAGDVLGEERSHKIN